MIQSDDEIIAKIRSNNSPKPVTFSTDDHSQNEPLYVPYILDVEASGFSSQSYPIEVGVVINEEDKYCSLIQRPSHWNYWDPSAEAVHKITRTMLFQQGKMPKQVAQELNKMLQDKIVYSDGWVVDEPWLNRLFEEAKISRQFHFYDIETTLSEAQMQVWSAAKKQVQQELGLARHRASSDALVIQKTFIKSWQMVKKNKSQS